MDGEVNLMQIYGENNADEHSVEMMFSYEELKELVIALSDLNTKLHNTKKIIPERKIWGSHIFILKTVGRLAKKAKMMSFFTLI